MQVIKAKSVSDGLATALQVLRDHGQEKDSRNGPVIAMQEPVSIEYVYPQNHVITSPMRNANPFFHFMEAFWMLAGRNDVEFLTYYAKRLAEYSDDGKTLHGAYGNRWRHWFGYDQLDAIITELKHNPDSRRCVLAIWDGGSDDHPMTGNGDLQVAINGGKDVPCNTHAYFKISGEHLNMTVSNRSNDAIWGAFGANAVHFSMLLMYMADCIGVKVGTYHQITDNLHVYTNVLPVDKWWPLQKELVDTDPYKVAGTIEPTRQIYLRNRPEWDHATKLLMARNFDALEWQRFTSNFFAGVARPIGLSYQLYKEKRYKDAVNMAMSIGDKAWRQACAEWLQRSIAKKERS